SFYFNQGSNGTYNASHVQAYDSATGNQWNTTTGYGNYWYDWANNNNSNDVNPHNGIVDWPYKLDGGTNAEDYHPLANSTPYVPEFSMLYPIIVVLLAALILRRKL
ncbi:MAG: right-handed parallel beta-helix repeat-containing protein, partial [Euryarchaeota archaeon]|nr:right-handed parallel beta-helix repeat-containing protein [Euryarchaeota archaeon]